MLRTLPTPPLPIPANAVIPLTANPSRESRARAASPGEKPKDDASCESLFEHFAWLYIFCRERLFRDDTERMIQAVWPKGRPAAGEKVIELGCGPGFYSCGLAELFRDLNVLGIDRSPSQLEWAREKARANKLHNCRFQSDNVLELSHNDNSFDVLIASRLFTVLPDRRRAVAEMFRVLRAGGRCFIAEPRYSFWASIPLFTMWLLAGLTRFRKGYREPSKARVFAPREMENLLSTQPWRKLKTWRKGRYQYALCEKG